MAGRPIILSIVALLLGIVGLIGTVGGIIGLLDTQTVELAVALIVSIITLATAIGIWKGIKIFWYIGVLIAIINIITYIYNIITTGAYVFVVSIVLNLIILWYLFRPKVKKHFGF